MKPNTVVWASALGLTLAIGGAVNTKPVSANESLPSINAKQVSKMPLIASYKLYGYDDNLNNYKESVYYLQSLKIMELPNKNKIYHVELNVVSIYDHGYHYSSNSQVLLISENTWNNCINKNIAVRVSIYSKSKELGLVSANRECYGGEYVSGVAYQKFTIMRKEFAEIVTATNNLIKIINSNGGNLKYLPKK